MIGRGAHGIVSRDSKGRVHKRLHASVLDAEACVHREFAYLERLSVALARQPFLTCPTPLATDRSTRTLIMTYGHGQPLDAFIDEPSTPFEAHVEHIAEQIALALDVYVHTFAEAYVSLSTANLLYDVDTRILTLLDFTKARTFHGIDGQRYVTEISLGCLVARSAHHTVGPRSVWRRHVVRRYERLLTAVFRSAPETLARDVIVDVATRVRGALLAPTALDNKRAPTWIIGQAWHRSVGAAVYGQRVHAIVGSRYPPSAAP